MFGDLWNVSVIGKTSSSFHVSEGDVVRVIVIQHIVKALHYPCKSEYKCTFLTLIIEQIEPEVDSMKFIRSLGSETGIFLKPLFMFCNQNI